MNVRGRAHRKLSQINVRGRAHSKQFDSKVTQNQANNAKVWNVLIQCTSRLKGTAENRRASMGVVILDRAKMPFSSSTSGDVFRDFRRICMDWTLGLFAQYGNNVITRALCDSGDVTDVNNRITIFIVFSHLFAVILVFYDWKWQTGSFLDYLNPVCDVESPFI